MGGGAQALSLAAEEFFNHLSSEQQQSVKRIFAVLVGIDVKDQPRRLVAPRKEFLPQDWALLQQFAVDEFPLIFIHSENGGEQSAEFIQDELLYQWPALVTWIEEEKQFLRSRKDLAERVEFWNHNRRLREHLIVGAALLSAQQCLESYSARLGESEREYIELSLAAQRSSAVQGYPGSISGRTLVAGIVIALSALILWQAS